MLMIKKTCKKMDVWWPSVSSGALLLAAVSSGNPSMLQAALKRWQSQEDMGCAMQVACQFGYVDVVKKLLSETDYNPCRHAMWAACTGGHQGIVQLLMQHGMSVTDVEHGICERHGHSGMLKALGEQQTPV